MRIIVVYGSTRGGTAELARAVAEALVNRGVDASIGNANAVDDLTGYDAVIVGGALYGNRWHEDAAEFVDRNLASLRATNVWFFSSGPLDNSASSGALAPIDHVKQLARLVDIRGHVTFGGVLKKKHGLFASLFAWGNPGDYRDPEQIIIWIDRVVPKLDEPKQSAAARSAAASSAAAAASAAQLEEPAESTGVFKRLATSDTSDRDDDMGLDMLAELAD